MSTRLDGPEDRVPTDAEYAALRMAHKTFRQVIDQATDKLREQTQQALAETLDLPIEQVKSMWWASGCT